MEASVSSMDKNDIMKKFIKVKSIESTCVYLIQLTDPLIDSTFLYFKNSKQLNFTSASIGIFKVVGWSFYLSEVHTITYKYGFSGTTIIGDVIGRYDTKQEMISDNFADFI